MKHAAKLLLANLSGIKPLQIYGRQAVVQRLLEETSSSEAGRCPSVRPSVGLRRRTNNITPRTSRQDKVGYPHRTPNRVLGSLRQLFGFSHIPTSAQAKVAKDGGTPFPRQEHSHSGRILCRDFHSTLPPQTCHSQASRQQFISGCADQRVVRDLLPPNRPTRSRL